MNLLVAGRVAGSCLIIVAYFVILHISTLYGAIIHVIADVICMPFYIKHKQFDVVIMLCFLATIAISTESVMKPDHDLRGCAHNQGCYEQLMEIRQHVLDYLKTLKEVTHHTNADESDEIETEKLSIGKAKCLMTSLKSILTNMVMNTHRL